MAARQHEEQKANHIPVAQTADLLEIIFYTDPLCCWSWAFEPQWRKFLYEFDGQINYRYCMGGLLPGWKNFHDTVNAVSRPIQMGPVWMHAQQLSGMPIDTTIWMRDAPVSSYPACIAVKCAELQSRQAGEVYLRLLREAVMLHGENIAKQEVLVKLATQLTSIITTFDTDTFQQDLINDNGLEAFRKDLHEVQNRQVNRFPALVIRGDNNKAVMVSGYRPYTVLLEAVKQVKDLKATHQEIDEDAFKQFWPFATERELAEITTASTPV